MEKKSKKGLIGLAIAIVLVLILSVIPVAEGATRQGYQALGLFLGAIIMWICETMPMMITAFLVMFIFPILNIMPLNTVYTSFGGVSFFFAIATFGLSAALERTSVPLRICHALTKSSKGNSKALVIALMFACLITSGIMSNLSTTIIYLALALALLKANGCEPGKSNLGRCLLIGIPAMAGCGGMITPAGTPGNALIIGILAERGVNLSFLQWTLIFAPMALITCLVAGLTITAVFKPERISDEAQAELDRKLEECGKMKPQEKRILGLILIILVLWILGTWVPAFNYVVVAVIGMAIMFLPGIKGLDYEYFVKKTNWNLAFTIGSVGVLIGALTSTGIVDHLVTPLFAPLANMNPILIMFIVGVIVVIIRAFIPTAPAIAALFAPLLLPLAGITALSVTSVMVLPAFWACTPMLLWIEPIFLFTFGYNYYTPGELLKWGWIPSLIMCVILSFTPFYLQLFGL